MANEQTIADLAYSLWQARGCPEGSSDVDWREAERQITGGKLTPAALPDEVDASLKETFPASDPVANHLSDAPPVNAEQKWAAAGKPPKK